MSDEARNALIEQWMHFAEGLANRNFTMDSRFDREERKSVAFEALVRAAEKFDPARGLSFGTYCGACIWRALRRESYRQGSQIKRPTMGSDAVEPMQKAMTGDYYSRDEEPGIEDRDYVEWLMSHFTDQEAAVAIGIMEERKYVEMEVPSKVGFANNGSKVSRVSSLKRSMLRKARQAEEDRLEKLRKVLGDADSMCEDQDGV